MHIEFHDIHKGKDRRLEVADLTPDAIHNAKYLCEQMLEELETAQEKIDAEESDDEGD